MDLDQEATRLYRQVTNEGPWITNPGALTTIAQPTPPLVQLTTVQAVIGSSLIGCYR